MNNGLNLDGSAAFLETLMKRVLNPMISDLAKEARQPVEAKVVVSFRSEIAERTLSADASRGAIAAAGEIRVLVYEPNPNDYSFVAAAKFSGLSTKTGQVEFQVRGRLWIDEDRGSYEATRHLKLNAEGTWGQEFHFSRLEPDGERGNH
jgi:hypothetical protein